MPYKIYLYDTDQDGIGSGTLSSAYVQQQLQVAGGQEVELRDASRGGAALASHWQPTPGTALELVMPGLNGGIPARVVRSGNGAVALAFRQDAASMALADRMLERIAARPLAA